MLRNFLLKFDTTWNTFHNYWTFALSNCCVSVNNNSSSSCLYNFFSRVSKTELCQTWDFLVNPIETVRDIWWKSWRTQQYVMSYWNRETCYDEITKNKYILVYVYRVKRLCFLFRYSRENSDSTRALDGKTFTQRQYRNDGRCYMCVCYTRFSELSGEGPTECGGSCIPVYLSALDFLQPY